jgi:hypothetical protein
MSAPEPVLALLARASPFDLNPALFGGPFDPRPSSFRTLAPTIRAA